MTAPRTGRGAGALASLALVVGATVAALALAEGALRVVSPPTYAIWPPGLERTFAPASGRLPGVSGPSHFRVSELGLRADALDPRDGYRILALGGSTTECVYLDHDEAWPERLQAMLNADGHGPRTWVGNGGKSGRNTRHHVLAMRHLPLEAWRINAVLVLAGVNDFASRLAEGDAYDPHALEHPAMARRLVGEAFQRVPGGYPGDPWYKGLALWKLLHRARERWETPATAADGGQDAQGDAYDVWRQHRVQAGELRVSLPDLGPALDEFGRNLREVVSLARARGVRPILMTQPAMWRDDLPPALARLLWLGGVGDFMKRPGQPYYAVGALAEGMRRYNDVVRQVCASERVECIELTTLPQDTATFYDDVHFNEAGARAVAAIVAGHLAARPPYAAAR
jgi:lysophospholipase L1-like esterase